MGDKFLISNDHLTRLAGNLAFNRGLDYEEFACELTPHNGHILKLLYAILFSPRQVVDR